MTFDFFKNNSLFFFAAATLLGSCSQKQTSIIGKFENTKGVMEAVSCYCYQSGYVTTSDGQNVPICFKDEQATMPTCEQVEMKGFFKMETIKNKPDSPCPAGTMNLFYVTSFSCK